MAFSGGWDSTYILWHLLNNTDDQVHCFHVNLEAVEYADPHVRHGHYAQIYEAERLTVPAIIAWLSKNVRAITYEEVKIDAIKQSEWMNPVVIKTGAEFPGDYDRFIYGSCPEHRGTQGRIEHWRKIWDAYAPKTRTLEFLLQDLGKCQPHAMVEMSLLLQVLINNCLFPIVENGKPEHCGRCFKCVTNRWIEKRLDKGVSPDDVLAELKRARRKDAKLSQAAPQSLKLELDEKPKDDKPKRAANNQVQG